MIVGVCGFTGTGKTLLITFVSKYEQVLRGVNVYANYDLKFPHKKISVIEDLKNITTKKNLIAFDELWITAEARRSGTQKNIKLSRMILQSRKLDADVYYSVQKPKQLETRVIGITNYFWYPQIILTDDNGIPKVLTVHVFKPDLTDSQAEYIGNFDLYVYGTHLLYDTNEVIEETKSIEYEDMINKYKSKMLENPKLSKSKIKSMMILEDGLSKSDADIYSSYL